MDTEVQPSPPHENGSKIEESSSDPPGEMAKNGEELKTPPKAAFVRQTRSRSRTPQTKKDKQTEDDTKASQTKNEEALNGHEEKKMKPTEKKPDTIVEEKNEEVRKSPEKQVEEPTTNGKEVDNDTVEAEAKLNELSKPESDFQVEMDPLILVSDELDPELQFDENSDIDSGKGSPALSRCKTRRSHTRNVPTPKTPKSSTDSESDKNSTAPTPTPENLADLNDSLNFDDVSTRAEAGNDSTRLEYISNNVSVFSEDNSYLNYTRERSLSETLRSLSPRRSIRPLNDAYRQRAFRNNLNSTKSQLNSPYLDRDSVDRFIGSKRKRSLSPEGEKRFKTTENGGFLSFFSNLRYKWSGEENSSTPKLTGYKDSKQDLHESEGFCSEVVTEDTENKAWCVVM